jgi:threonine dehydrogenase-like Zn-dependent dehydrogenase
VVKAIVRRGSEVFLDRDAPEPVPGPGDAVVRPTLCGVASADLAAARNEGRAGVGFQGVLGHQFVGVVESVADERHARLVGERVVADITVVDPASELARRGLARHAPDRQILGLLGRDGCFAEKIALPAANLSIVPETVSDDAAVFAEPLSAAVHASRIVRLEGKTFVTVLGDSLSALLCAQVMARLNHSVRLLGEREDRLAIAERWGVRRRPVSEAGLRQDQDVVIECTGQPEMIERAFGMVRPRGSVVLKREPLPLPGGTPSGSGGPDLTPVVLHELEIVGASVGRVGEAVVELASGELDLAGLITKRHTLDDGLAALRAADEPSAIKVVIEVGSA